MRQIFFFLFLIFSLSVFADTQIKTQIHDIDVGMGQDVPLIFLTSGHVVSYPFGKKTEMDQLREGLQKKLWFLFTINEKREIIEIQEDSSPSIQNDAPEKSINFSETFSPSILKSMDEAQTVFTEARRNARQESQCFNRAHVWSYEWRTKRNLYSSKAWVFFTRKYIRKYKFEWWFHVAPMVHVVHDGEVKERVMDIKYSKGPLKLKQWTDIFMRDSAHCRVVDKYSDQANFPESGSCFVMKSSMYYYQPIDLELLEVLGQEKTKWLEPEVRHAFMDAFQVTL